MNRSEKVRKAGWAIVAGGALAWLSVPAGAQSASKSAPAQGGASAVFAQSGQPAENQLVPMTEGGQAVAESQQEGINVVDPGAPSGKDMDCGASDDSDAQGRLDRNPVAAQTANPRNGGPAMGSDHSKSFQLKLGGQVLTLTSRWKGGASVCAAKLGLKESIAGAQGGQSGMPNLLYEVPNGGAVLAPNHRGGALVIVIIKAGSGPVATVTIDSAGHAQLQANPQASANDAGAATSPSQGSGR